MAALRVPDHRFVLLLFSDSLPFLPHPLLPSAFILTPLVRPPPSSSLYAHISFSSSLLYFQNPDLCPPYFFRLPCRTYLLSLFRSGHKQALMASPCDVSITSLLPPKQRHTWLHCKFNCHLQPTKYQSSNWTKQQELNESCVLCLCVCLGTCACVRSTQLPHSFPAKTFFFFLLIHKLFMRKRSWRSLINIK